MTHPEQDALLPFSITAADIGRYVRDKRDGKIGIVKRDEGNGWLHPYGLKYEWRGQIEHYEYVTVTPAPPQGDARAAFEKIMREECPLPEIADKLLEKMPDGNYRSPRAFTGYEGFKLGAAWQAALTRSAPSLDTVSVPVSELIRCRDYIDGETSMVDKLATAAGWIVGWLSSAAPTATQPPTASTASASGKGVDGRTLPELPEQWKCTKLREVVNVGWHCKLQELAPKPHFNSVMIVEGSGKTPRQAMVDALSKINPDRTALEGTNDGK